MKDKLPVRFATADGPCRMDAVLLELDDKTGRTAHISRLQIE